MTEERLVLADLLEKAGEGDFLRAVAEAVLQLLMETDVEGLIGAGRYERSGERITCRNGYRDRTLDPEWLRMEYERGLEPQKSPAGPGVRIRLPPPASQLRT
jgi:transposase-like protein